MKNIIQKLPHFVANQIAAGEVVQRPASVAKELLENSIDAGATKIKLYVKEGGKTLVQVVDDGIGMNKTDCITCFERHATSKIKKATDLFQLTTKGFRGEAMAATAAIAQVHLISKPSDSETGTEVIIEGGTVKKQTEIVAHQGTSITVKNLFFNIPARRQFLKNDSVEFRHVLNEFYRVALPHENIAFELYHNEKLQYQLPSQNRRQRIGAIFGHEKGGRLMPVSEYTEIVKVEGFVGKPAFAQKKRGEQFLFVNGRFVKSPYLNHAINTAFEGLIGQGKHPSYFLFIEIDPAQIDINIHPSKTEIKFEDEKIVYNLIKASVKHTLGQFQIAQSFDFDKNPNFEIPENYSAPIVNPKIAFDPNYSPFKNDTLESPREKNNQKGWENIYDTTENEVNEPAMQPLFSPKNESPQENKTLQIAEKYILCKVKSGFMLIHQNRAHQRICYEKLQQTKETVWESQRLLFPVILSFDLASIETLKLMADDLKKVGFSIDFEKTKITVKGIPPLLKESQIESALRALDEQPDDEDFEIEKFIYQKLATEMAVKSGVKLTSEARQNLIDELFTCKNHKQCPTGKKIIETFNEQILERIFDKNFSQ